MFNKILDTWAATLREELVKIRKAPPDKSLNQLKDQAIVRQFHNVAELTRKKVFDEELYAVGTSPEDCIRAAGKKLKWGKITDLAVLEGGDPKYTWGRRFCADGMSMKAAGWEVPGGFVMTWWK